MIRVYLFFFMITAISCSDHKTKSLDEQKRPEYSYSLQKSSTINIPIDESTSFTSNNFYYHIFGEEEFLITQNKFKNSIQAYSLGKRQKVLEISIPRDGPNSIKQLRGFTFVNFDSIYVYDNLTLSNAILVDSSGSRKPANLTLSDRFFNHASMTKSPSYFYDGDLYFFKFPNRALDESLFDEEVPFEYVHNVHSNIGKMVSFSWPDIYKGKNWGGILTIPSRTMNLSGELIYSFGIDPHIYRLNQNGDVQKYLARSDYLSGRTNPLEKNASFEKLDEHFMNENYYGNIIYDKYRNVYYRYAGLKMNPRNADGSIRSSRMKPFSIIILNSEFKKVGETLLEPIEEFFIRDWFVTKEGLMISANNIQNPQISEDYIDVKLFFLHCLMNIGKQKRKFWIILCLTTY